MQSKQTLCNDWVQSDQEVHIWISQSTFNRNCSVAKYQTWPKRMLKDNLNPTVSRKYHIPRCCWYSYICLDDNCGFDSPSMWSSSNSWLFQFPWTDWWSASNHYHIIRHPLINQLDGLVTPDVYLSIMKRNLVLCVRVCVCVCVGMYVCVCVCVCLFM